MRAHLLFAGMALLLATSCWLTAPQERNLVVPESKDDSSSTTLALVAAGASPGSGALSVPKTSISQSDFNNGVACGPGFPYSVTATNTGSGSVTLSGISTTYSYGGGVTWNHNPFDATVSPTSISPGGTATITITFQTKFSSYDGGSISGLYTGTATLVTSVGTFTIALTGNSTC